MAIEWRLCRSRHRRHYLPFLTMSGKPRAFADVIENADQIRKKLIGLPDIVFTRLQAVEEAQ
jgi:hypothetical protein